jgi:hypothetical protein
MTPSHLPSYQCTSTQPAVSNPQSTPPSHQSLTPMYLYTARSIQSTHYATLQLASLRTVTLKCQQYQIHKLRHLPNFPSLQCPIPRQRYPLHTLRLRNTCPYFRCTPTQPGYSIHTVRHLPTYPSQKCTFVPHEGTDLEFPPLLLLTERTLCLLHPLYLPPLPLHLT